MQTFQRFADAWETDYAQPMYAQFAASFLRNLEGMQVPAYFDLMRKQGAKWALASKRKVLYDNNHNVCIGRGSRIAGIGGQQRCHGLGD